MRPKQSTPIVFEHCTSTQLIRFLITQHAAPTNMIICGSRDDFLQELLHELDEDATPASRPGDAAGDGDAATGDTEGPTPEKQQDPKPATSSLTPLLLPTLATLSASRSIILSFCPDLTHLLALLSTLPYRNSNISNPSLDPKNTSKETETRRILALWNPIRLHKPTSSFSAQGFNRTFAAAVETAHILEQQLVVVETPFTRFQDRGYEDGDMRDEYAAPTAAEESDVQRVQRSSPWDEQLSILNVTTKTFGVGDRGWWAGLLVSDKWRSDGVSLSTLTSTKICFED